MRGLPVAMASWPCACGNARVAGTGSIGEGWNRMNVLGARPPTLALRVRSASMFTCWFSGLDWNVLVKFMPIWGEGRPPERGLLGLLAVPWLCGCLDGKNHGQGRLKPRHSASMRPRASCPYPRERPVARIRGGLFWLWLPPPTGNICVHRQASGLWENGGAHPDGAAPRARLLRAAFALRDVVARDVAVLDRMAAVHRVAVLCRFPRLL